MSTNLVYNFQAVLLANTFLSTYEFLTISNAYKSNVLDISPRPNKFQIEVFLIG